MITQKLRYTGLRGETIEAEGSAGVEVTVHPSGHPLRMREIRLGPDRLVGQLTASAADELGYRMIHNEILTGLRMYIKNIILKFYNIVTERA